MKNDILIVDDEEGIRNLIRGILDDEGYQSRLAANATEAYNEIESDTPSLVILDIWLQGSEHDGIEILKIIKKKHPDLPVIMISGHGTIETAVSAIKIGAYDFIEKPFKSDRLLLMIRRAREAAALLKENRSLKRQISDQDEMIGESSSMEIVNQIIERAAPTNSRILITGEPGTGKNLAAKIIHKRSRRNDQPFLTLNCATLKPDTIEEKLFGSGKRDSEKNGKDTKGILEQAAGGTLLLDEVADMPLETQGKIVRLLQEQRFQRLDNDDHIDIDVRIIATSNRNLEKAIKKGNFREDLYYRLNVVPLYIPALRERTEDILAMVAYFAREISESSGLPSPEFLKETQTILQTYEWPGNIRQLRNIVEWSMIMSAGGTQNTISPQNLPYDLNPSVSKNVDINGHNTPSNQNLNSETILLPLRKAREKFERDYLLSQIERFNGNISKTAEFIGMERSALHRKLKSLDITSAEKADKVKETA